MTVLGVFGFWAAAACAAAGLTQRPRQRPQHPPPPVVVWPVDRIVDALRVWAQGHGGFAPRRGDWHAEKHPDYVAEPDRWPAASVMRVFGSCQDACVAAGLMQRPRRPPQRSAALAAQRVWPASLIVSALHAWAAEHDGFAPRYTDWSASDGAHGDYLAERDRWPAARTVTGVFGSWPAACSAAALTPRPPVPSGTRSWSRPQIIQALRAWADEHDGLGPRAEDWRSGDPRRHGCRDVVPETRTVERHFGSWEAALAVAGVRRRPRLRAVARWDQDAIAEALRRWAEAHDGLGPRVGDWGSERLPDYVADKQRWPSGTTVAHVYGSWPAACAAAGVTQRPKQHRTVPSARRNAHDA